MTKLFTVDLGNNRLDDRVKGFSIGYTEIGPTMELLAAADCGQGGNGWAISPVQSRKVAVMRQVNNLSRLHQCVYLHPHGISIPTTHSIKFARNYHNDATMEIYSIYLSYVTGTGYQIGASVDSNTTSPMYNSGAFTLDYQNDWNVIEYDWLANDTTGYFKLWLNGVLKWNRSVINGNLRVNYPCLGAVYPAYAISGSMYFSYWVGSDDSTELTPPRISSAAIANATPARIVMVYSEIVSSGNFVTGLSVKVNGSPRTINSAVLQGDNKTLWVTLASPCANGDVVTLSYAKATGSVVDVAANTLPSYTDYSVTNNILPPQPVEVTSIECGTVDQYTVAVLFNEVVHSTDFKAGVSITVNGSVATISTATLQGDNVTVRYVITTKIIPSDTVLWSYDSAVGGILDPDNMELADVSNHAVTNNAGVWYLLFDDFKTGDFSRISGNYDNDSDLSVTSAAAMFGAVNGLSVIVDDNSNSFLYYNITPDSNSNYLRIHLDFDPNSISMAQSDEPMMMGVYNASGQLVAQIEAFYMSGYKLLIASYNDAGNGIGGGVVDITDAPHSIELRINRGAGTGSFELLVDGSSKWTVSNVDNDTRLTNVSYVYTGILGAETGTRGTYYLGNFIIINRNENIE